jgi:hypothetical protein
MRENGQTFRLSPRFEGHRCQRPKKKSHPTRFKPQTKKATQSNPFQKPLIYRPTLLLVQKSCHKKPHLKSQLSPKQKSQLKNLKNIRKNQTQKQPTPNKTETSRRILLEKVRRVLLQHAPILGY